MKRLLLEHFNIKDKIGILDSLYANFKKAHIASFTGKLAKGFFASFLLLSGEQNESCSILFSVT